MFDRTALAALLTTAPAVARVVIAAHDGSSPREVGAAMLVSATGQTGTIGGGALEWQACARARALLATEGTGGSPRIDREPLAPTWANAAAGRSRC